MSVKTPASAEGLVLSLRDWDFFQVNFNFNLKHHAFSINLTGAVVPADCVFSVFFLYFFCIFCFFPEISVHFFIFVLNFLGTWRKTLAVEPTCSPANEVKRAWKCG